MARGKKTVEVKELRDHANKLLAMEECSVVNTGFKSGVCAMIEKVLHLTGNYEGYSYLKDDEWGINSFGYFSRKYY